MTYEYFCANCNLTWETEQKITEPALTHCNTCNQETAKRLISASNFILKGGGWFKEGYSSK